MNIIKTGSSSIAYYRNTMAKTHVCELFNMSRGANEEDVVSLCPIIWEYDMDLFVALMFYIRDIRKNPVDDLNYPEFKSIPKGKGEKMLSYWMAFWLLNNHEISFAKNFTRFVRDIGYYKDCLIMAKMAYEMKYSDNKIMLILMPLAHALSMDENKILKAHVNNMPREKLSLSLASKWAPRQGKSYSMLIPYMKKLCNISGTQSDAKWRKYIQSIVKATTVDTVEKLLSTKNYNKINFKSVPSKAFNLYKNTFTNTPELNKRFTKFVGRFYSGIESVHVDDIHPHEILTQYLNVECMNWVSGNHTESHITEAQWKFYLDSAKEMRLSLNHNDCMFIPMIDISGSMFDNKMLPIKVALTLGITLSQINNGIFKHKSITFSTKPVMMDIEGDTALDQIGCVFNEFSKPENIDASRYSTDFVKAFECLLEFCVSNDVLPDDVAKIKVIAMSDMEFEYADPVLGMSMTPLQVIRKKFAESGYIAPQIIYWNLNGHMSHTPCMFNDTGVSTLRGFEPSIINTFLETGELDPSAIIFQTLSAYKQLVA